MKTALVLGITGGFGGHVAEALVADGWQVKALMRDMAKLPAQFRNVEAIAGDAGRIEDVRRAAAGVDVMIYGINAPYPMWDRTVLPWLDVTATVAEEKKLTIVFPGNVYVFDPADGPDFDERAPLRPVTSKGCLRAAMEARLNAAAGNGARIIIVRAGDFIGAYAPSAWMAHLIKATRRGYALSATTAHNAPHTWAYLPDVAQVVVALLARRARLAAFSVFHFRGYRATFADIAAALREASGRPVALKKFPWWVLRLARPFSPLIRALFEMRYLWQREINLDESKLTGELDGAVVHTPLAQALTRAGLLRRR